MLRARRSNERVAELGDGAEFLKKERFIAGMPSRQDT